MDCNNHAAAIAYRTASWMETARRLPAAPVLHLPAGLSQAPALAKPDASAPRAIAIHTSLRQTSELPLATRQHLARTAVLPHLISSKLLVMKHSLSRKHYATGARVQTKHQHHAKVGNTARCVDRNQAGKGVLPQLHHELPLLGPLKP